jgi:hypothetical protein
LKTAIRTFRKIGVVCVISCAVFACVKKTDPALVAPDPTYTTLSAFLTANAVRIETFNLDATTGGSFTSAKGTNVTINPNILVDLNGNPATGNVKVDFRDIYAKSDMLLSDMPSILASGAPLKSAGEFFIKITQNNNPLDLAAKKSITISQPNKSGFTDFDMRPFIFEKSSAITGWISAPKDSLSNGDSLGIGETDYIFPFHKFSFPLNDGTWGNSDNATYFAKYPQTVLTIVPDFNIGDYDMNIYLLFKGINTNIHVYKNSGLFTYNYVPVGLSCTIVAVAIRDKKLNSSFTDITIGSNQITHVPISETKVQDFINKVKSLD